MREPDRIPGLLDRLGQVWQQHPDLRLGQLLLNAIRVPDGNLSQTANQLFFVEDEQLIGYVEIFYGQHLDPARQP